MNNEFLQKNPADSIYNMITQQYEEEDELYELIELRKIQKKIKFNKLQEPITIDEQNRKEFYKRLNTKCFLYIEGDKEVEKVKLYLPLSKENYANNVDRLIEILYEIYIKSSKKIGLCKFRHAPANDAVTLRLSQEQSEYFMELMKDNMDILNNSVIKPNFLIPTINNIGIIPDARGSYNTIVSEIINEYIDICVKKATPPKISEFLEFIQVIEKDKENYLKTHYKLMKYIGNEISTVDIFLEIFKKAIINQMDNNELNDEFHINQGKMRR